MVTEQDLESKKEKICIVGLGYVGLPLAVQLSKYFIVIGFDINENRIEGLKKGFDNTREVSEGELHDANIEYTSDKGKIKQAKFIIVAVPTPVDKNNIPDLSILKNATHVVGSNLEKGSIVIYESTVYPGVTEDICLPILEESSSLKSGEDFKIGYSPERVNPGDKEHTIDRIIKVVSAMDDESLGTTAFVYGKMTQVYKASSIKVAEAAKVIENTQRDLNIALMNELAVLFNKMEINIYDVLEAAGTKWNFLPFKPGLVGGHCIGVDPYYLTYKATEVGHTPKLILAGRGINDSMHRFVAHQIVKEMIRLGKDIKKSKFVIFGITFKENVSDIRNSKVAELYFELADFGIKPVVYDPLANPQEVKEEYNIELCKKEDLPLADTLIVAVPHNEFARMRADDIRLLMNEENLLLADIKNIYNKEEIKNKGIKYWTL
ncbi:MAG: nucleotide sugar dehydrogenase [bacterium]